MSTPNMFMQRSKYVCGYPHLPVAMAFSLDVACVVPLLQLCLSEAGPGLGLYCLLTEKNNVFFDSRPSLFRQ